MTQEERLTNPKQTECIFNEHSLNAHAKLIQLQKQMSGTHARIMYVKQFILGLNRRWWCVCVCAGKRKYHRHHQRQQQNVPHFSHIGE